MNLERN